MIFALPERTPSQVLSTRDGLHLFWVSVSEPEVQLEFAQARPLAARMVLREKQDAAVRALLDPHKGADSFVPTREELATLLASGDARTLVLRVGEEQLHLDELSRLVLAAGESGQGRPALDMARAVVEERYRREVAARLALAQGLDKSPAFTAAPGRARGAHAGRVPAGEADARRDRRERPAALLRRQPRSATRRHSWSAPRSCRFPSRPRRPATWPSWSAREPTWTRAARRLTDLGRRLGGEVKDLGWRSLDELERAAPGITNWALELQPGRHSAPFRTPRMIVVAKVLSRRDPEPPGPRGGPAAARRGLPEPARAGPPEGPDGPLAPGEALPAGRPAQPPRLADSHLTAQPHKT